MALQIKFRHSLKKKIVVQKNFSPITLFFMGLNGKFHINFAVDSVFELLVSTKKNVHWSFQLSVLFEPNVNDLFNTKSVKQKRSLLSSL